jgi:5-methyltetrahydropteroyltriglutamate--homocysteine methyltransferase
MIREPSVEEYKKLTMVRIEALNHALRGLPPERVRYHLCWGSWLGRMYRHPMRDTSM